jgi:hypothetical protein
MGKAVAKEPEDAAEPFKMILKQSISLSTFPCIEQNQVGFIMPDRDIIQAIMMRINKSDRI